MLSAEYLDVTHFDENVLSLERDHPDRIWALGSEALLLAAMTSNATALEGIVEIHSDMNTRFQDWRMQTLGKSPIGAGYEAVAQETATRSDEQVVATVEEFKGIFASRQAIACSEFFRKRVVGGGGEDAQSFNRRAMRSTVTSWLWPLAMELSRVRSGPEQYELTSASGVTWTEKSGDDKPHPLLKLHATLLELDAFVAAFHVAMERRLPYIPVFAGPAGERAQYRKHGSKNTNTDILMVHENAEHVIPMQVKVKRSPYEEDAYHDSVVLIDSLMLNTWSSDLVIEKDAQGNPHSKSQATIVAGRITRKICQAYRRPKPPKTFGKIAGTEEVVDNIFEAISSNPYHSHVLEQSSNGKNKAS